eukprot:15430777-Alexandrium_andersonii.AAC.1
MFPLSVAYSLSGDFFERSLVLPSRFESDFGCATSACASTMTTRGYCVARLCCGLVVLVGLRVQAALSVFFRGGFEDVARFA